MELIFLIKEKMKIILEVINSIKNFCKNTRGVRIVKCRVNSDGKKIVVFQALGSFHTEDMDYEDYKNGLIYDTEPYDVELAAIFFHSFNFDKYKIYSFDPINQKISICDSTQKNVIEIDSSNWLNSVQYFKKMDTAQLKHVLNILVNFEVNKLMLEKPSLNQISAEEDFASPNVVNIEKFKKKKE